MSSSTFYRDGYADGERGAKYSPPSVGVYAEEYRRGYIAADAANHRHKAPEGECAYCDAARAAGSNFHPPHDASKRCESGKHSHCSCDTCF